THGNMKRSIAFLLLAFSAATVHAGSFGGPTPFSNGSPLQSGTDGVYQAVASATNLTGLFTWTIQNGVQTTGKTNNSWIFFIDGLLLTGTTSANISEDKVAGILDAGFSNGIAQSANGTLTLPYVFVVPGNAGAGEFNGKINLKSSIASFSGEGVLTGTPERTDQIIYIRPMGNNTFFFVDNSTWSPVSVTPVHIPGSLLQTQKFKFRGSRLTVSTTTTSTATP
ncbi:MAG: hypothetical protein WCL71_17125, partial [Deltaproteobacteria bacterium]